MANITMKELLEAGVHFGHQTKRWNPKMKEFIFGERNGIYIIDLQKTLKMFKDASKFVQDSAAEGKTVLFVGTKRQAQDAIAEEAQRCGMFYVNNRWLGGLLTNWVTVQKSVKRLKDLDEMATDGRYELLPKKEVIKLERERKHLQANLAGIKSMSRLPDLIFVIDSNKEAIAVKEARKLGIPVVAVVDTNCDPTEVDWVIPGNDDALRAIRLFASKVADSIAEGAQAASDKQQEEIASAIEQPQAETKHVPTSADLMEEEELNMEEVLGGKMRKAPESETAPETETPAVDAVAKGQ
ncbi:MAG TPA: 30S ribosomal protein S2 [Candidatus Acidoferrales bacterium]|nr:30S ribosomal protein S2 [Candidatus Acidoferrales bacterium]